MTFVLFCGCLTIAFGLIGVAMEIRNATEALERIAKCLNSVASITPEAEKE